MKLNENSKIKNILKDKQSVNFLLKYIPNLFEYKELKYIAHLKLKIINGRGALIGLSPSQEKEIIQYFSGKTFQKKKEKKILYKNIELKCVSNYKKLIFSTYNEIAIPTSIIMGNYKNPLSILLSEYKQLVWETHNNPKFNYTTKFFGWNIFCIDYYTSNVDIRYFIHKKLNKGAYVYIYLDEYHIKYSSNYQKYHNTHDYAIVGYSLKTNTYSVIGYGKKHFEINNITWNDLSKSIFSEYNTMGTCMSIKLKKERINKKIDEGKLEKEFVKCFYAVNDCCGLSAVSKLVIEIKDTHYVDKRYIHLLIEHHDKLLDYINNIDISLYNLTRKIKVILHALWLQIIKNEILEEPEIVKQADVAINKIIALHTEIGKHLAFQ